MDAQSQWATLARHFGGEAFAGRLGPRLGDPPSRTAVAEALAAWPGSMVIVSHDTEFVAALRPQRVLMMPEGKLDFWDDGLLELVSLA